LAKTQGALILIASFIGALFFLSGLVFTLQGLGIVGPTTSFMFRSQSWIDNGIGILSAGIVLLAVAFYFRSRSKVAALKVPSDQQSPTEADKSGA
jgi:hypothetical protein